MSNSKANRTAFYQTFPDIREFKKLVGSFFDPQEDAESNVFIIDNEVEHTQMFCRILGDDAVIWYQEMEIIQKQFIYIEPNPNPDPLYIFQFVIDQNKNMELLNGEGVIKTKNLVLLNSLGRHALTLTSGYCGKILQMIVTHKFLSEYVPGKYLTHPVIEAITRKKETGLMVIDCPPRYLQYELIRMAEQFKGQSKNKINKLQLLSLTAKFIDAFFRIYLDETVRHNYLSDQQFKSFVKNYFRSRMYERFPGIKTLSAQLYISPSTFKRRFIVNFETTPLQYFKAMQMQEAKNKLLKKASIEEVAFKFNFSSISNFIRCFKKYHQCTPGSLISR